MSIDTTGIDTTGIDITCFDSTGIDPATDLDAHEGWQALAAASLGRLLTEAEMTVIGMVPVDAALDAWFPGLGDAARHEALSTLGP